MILESHEVLRATSRDGDGEPIDALGDPNESILDSLEVAGMCLQDRGHLLHRLLQATKTRLEARQVLIGLTHSSLHAIEPLEGQIHDGHGSAVLATSMPAGIAAKTQKQAGLGRPVPAQGPVAMLGAMQIIGAPKNMIGEVTVHSGPASLWRSVEPVVGTLRLTNARLWFRPNALLVQGGDLSLPLESIADVELGNSLWVIPNQIVVKCRNGKSHKLVVQHRDEWVAKIRHAIGK